MWVGDTAGENVLENVLPWKSEGFDCELSHPCFWKRFIHLGWAAADGYHTVLKGIETGQRQCDAGAQQMDFFA